MSTLFPGTSLDTFTNPSSGQFLNSPSHSGEHTNANDAILALETKVGVNGSAVATTLDFKLSGVPATDKAMSLTGTEVGTNKTFTNPNVGAAGSATTATVTTTGSATNISLNLVPKGTGLIQDNGTNLIDFRSSFQNFVKSGCLWSAVSGLNGTMTAGSLFVAGQEYFPAAVGSHTFTASKDTYVDYLVGTGLTYSEVANSAASPALTANALRLAKVVTNGSAITGVTTTSFDTLGNPLLQSIPFQSGELGYAQITSDVTITPSSNVYTSITGLSITVLVPPGGRDVKITFKGKVKSAASAGQNVAVAISDSVSGQVDVLNWDLPVSNFGQNASFTTRHGNPSVGAHTYSIQGSHSAAATNLVFQANNGLAPNPGVCSILVELI